jgi:pilus assembly protein Flp/PilA
MPHATNERRWNPQPQAFSRLADRSIKAHIDRESMRGLYEATGEISMMKKIEQAFVAFMKDESGQDLIEYALVAGLIGLGAVVAMTGLSGKIGNAFNTVGNNLSNSI